HGIPKISLRPNVVNLIDPRTRQVVSSIGLGPKSQFGPVPWDLVFSGGSAWVLSAQRLDRIDLKARRLAPIGRVPFGVGWRMAVGAGSLWLTQDGGSGVVRIDARTGKVLNRFSVAGQGAGVAFGSGSLWLARDQDVARVDPSSGRVLERIAISDSPVS